MTVLTSSNKVVIPGDGVMTSFAFSFIGVDASYIEVTFTDADGNETEIAQGPGTTQCQVTLNAAAPGALWGVGGTVVYNPSGTPIPAGSSLTIARILPLTQTVSLQNQASYGQYATAAEQAQDLQEMQLQQVDELFARALVAPISDPVAPLPLPAATQRAGQYLAFDDDGNPIAASGPAGNVPISTAMQPVVAAATLALARTAFGLGSMATEAIGAGLEDDGAGAVRVNSVTVPVSTTQSPTAADHLKEYVTSVALTINLPRANTVWNGYGFSGVNIGTAAIVTLVPNANDQVMQAAAGASFLIPGGAAWTIRTDGASAGTWYLAIAFPRAPTFQNAALWNGVIVESHASNAVTFAIKTLAGANPSAADPVYLAVRDVSAGLGDFSVLVLTAAASITIPAGGTIGASNGVAFRLWLVAFNDGGTVRLGVINCLSGTNIYPLGSVNIASSTLVSAGATAAQVFYTAGAGVTSKAFTILGHATYESGLATAGQWGVAPTTLQLFGPNVPLPGAVLQTVGNFTGAVATGATAIPDDDTIPSNLEGDQYLSQSITPTSAANLLEISAKAYLTNSASNVMAAALFQDSTTDALAAARQQLTGGANIAELSLDWAKQALLSVATTLKVRAGAASGTTTFNGSAGARKLGGVLNSFIRVREIRT